jgi:hypothetical protein
VTPRSAWAPRGGVGEIADRELDPDALGPEPPRVAHQAADRRAAGRQAAQHGGTDQPGRTRQQQHA